MKSKAKASTARSQSSTKPREWKGCVVVCHGRIGEIIYDTKTEAADMAEFYNKDFCTGHVAVKVKITEVTELKRSGKK